MAEQSPDPLREAAPAYDDLEAKRARAGVAAALFGVGVGEDEPERLTVGRYEIDSRLGAGGMGVVFRAHDPDLDRPVAVKLLHAESSADDKARARMQREARALAKLSHPNVITVYDVGTEDGQVFVAMELVAGRDLRRWLETSSPQRWRETLGLFIAAGRGLEAAHEVALVHRDFKPENVLVGDDGRVRVLDFGLARVHRAIDAPTAEDRSRGPSPSAVQTDGGQGDEGGEGGDEIGDIAHLPTAAFVGGLTETGALIGTPLYMAPELYAGQPADERSDQFAYCASLYEGVYRQLPFGSRNVSAHVRAVTEGRVVDPPADSPVPSRLWQIIARGLDAKPEARHPNMAALLTELEEVAHTQSPVEPPRSSRSSWVWLGGVALVVALVASVVALEPRLFGDDDQASDQPVARDETREQDVVPVSGSPVDPAKPDDARTKGAGTVETGAAETGAAETETADSETEEPETGAPDGDAGTGTDSVAEPATSGPELHGWCHLHEDRYTLLIRPNNRRGSFTHEGACYTCRVERRRSRTRNFSPRDCAGYSLCGKASADACE